MTKNSKIIVSHTSQEEPPYAIELVTNQYEMGKPSYTIRKHDPYVEGEITLSEKELDLIIQHIKQPF